MASSDIQTLLSIHFGPVNDALEFLEKLTPDSYGAESSDPFSSSIGAHMRHILDHYQALMLGSQAGYVDYTKRARESAVESDMALAQKSWIQIRQWLQAFTEDLVTASLEVMTEHGLVQSTTARELSFVSSHAVHHFAFMKQLAHNLDITLSDDVGVAPATLKNLREQAANS